MCLPSKRYILAISVFVFIIKSWSGTEKLVLEQFIERDYIYYYIFLLLPHDLYLFPTVSTVSMYPVVSGLGGGGLSYKVISKL